MFFDNIDFQPSVFVALSNLEVKGWPGTRRETQMVSRDIAGSLDLMYFRWGSSGCICFLNNGCLGFRMFKC